LLFAKVLLPLPPSTLDSTSLFLSPSSISYASPAKAGSKMKGIWREEIPARHMPVFFFKRLE
jgi:hypothetical protein